MRRAMTIGVYLAIVTGVAMFVMPDASAQGVGSPQWQVCTYYGTVARTKGFVRCQLAFGGHGFDRTVIVSPSCGQGRIRDTQTHQCRGPADVAG